MSKARTFSILLFAIIIFASATTGAAGRAFIEPGVMMSDHGSEGLIDTRFDRALMARGRSPSADIFHDSPSDYRPGITIGYVTEYDNAFLERSVFIDSADFDGRSDLGVMHLRRDTLGMSIGAGVSYHRASMLVGLYAAKSDVNVHSWMADGSEYHDHYDDFSVGISLGAGYEITDHWSAHAAVYRSVGDVDTIGRSDIVSIGMRYRF